MPEGLLNSHVGDGSPQLLHRIDADAEAGLVARGGIAVQRAFLDGLVERGDRLAIGLFRDCLVALLDGLAQRAQCGAQAGVLARLVAVRFVV